VEHVYRALLDLRRRDAAFRPDAGFDTFAVDDDTVVLTRETWMLLVRLHGASIVSLNAGRWERILTSEDDAFCNDGAVPDVDLERNRVRFYGPAAVLLRQR
jgi:hypothetical protein